MRCNEDDANMIRMCRATNKMKWKKKKTGKFGSFLWDLVGSSDFMRVEHSED